VVDILVDLCLLQGTRLVEFHVLHRQLSSTDTLLFSSFSTEQILEGSADYLLQYISFFPMIKAAFLVWCYYPKTQGAKVIYQAVVKPYVVPALGLGAAAPKKEKKED